MMQNSYTRITNQELEDTFRYFDRDHSGFIEERELFEAIKKFKKDITQDQVKKMVSKVDKDKSGKISIDGILKLFNT